MHFLPSIPSKQSLSFLFKAKKIFFSADEEFMKRTNSFYTSSAFPFDNGEKKRKDQKIILYPQNVTVAPLKSIAFVWPSKLYTCKYILSTVTKTEKARVIHELQQTVNNQLQLMHVTA